MDQLVEQAAAIMTAQGRIRRLLDANRVIVGELSLPGVLRRIVEAAREIADARYAALGMIGADGLLEQFVHTGMDTETVTAIGELPRGRGVLGALIQHPEPIRLQRIADDPRSSGFPPGHPPMTSFLGVPIRSRDAAYGNLYLTNRRDGGEFTVEDEELVLALAATAGIAIENARLYEESRRRQEWLRASGEISRHLLAANGSEVEVLQRIVDSVKWLAAADVVTLVLPTAERLQLEVAVATGYGERELVGLRYAVGDSIAWEAMQEGHGVRLSGVDQQPGIYLHLRPVVPVGEVMVLPLKGEQSPRGAIVVGRLAEHHPFSEADLEMGETFASQAALALELADARADQQRVTVLEDRDRIARDLHDHVIQRLFAAGLTVQSTAVTIADSTARKCLTRMVDDLDDTIRHIRTTIFALTESTPRSLRAMVHSLLEEIDPQLGLRPETKLEGPVDTLVNDSIIGDVEAVLREALTNIIKHAGASRVEIRIDARPNQLTVIVTDDGVGLGPSRRRSGLGNLRRRAEQRGGQLTLDQPPEGGGLRLQWAIPLTT